PVVEQRVGRHQHPAAVGPGVGRGDRVAGERVALAGRVQLDLETGWAPGEQRAQGAVGVDTSTEPGWGLVCDAIGLAVESDRGDPHERSAHHTRARVDRHAEVDRTRDAVGDGLAGGHSVIGDPEHACEVVPAPAGKHAEDRPGDRLQRVGEDPDHAVAAERDDRLSGPRGLASELARVLEMERFATAHAQAVPEQRLLDCGCNAPGLAAAGSWINDQADGIGHEASLVVADVAGGSCGTQAAGALCALLRRRRPIAAAIANAAITTNSPSRMPGARPMPPKGRETSSTRPSPTAMNTMIKAMIRRMPRMRARIPAEAGGTSRPMARRAKSWRPLGGACPRRSTALLRSPARRSARASDASAMRRICIRSCGRAAAMARWK